MSLINETNPVWQAVEDFVKGEIGTMSEHLESSHMDHDTTQVIRGQLAFARRVLALPETRRQEHEAAQASENYEVQPQFFNGDPTNPNLV